MEDLNTDDFIKSAELSNEVQIDKSVVVSVTPSKNKGSVMLGFSVGKEEVQVSQMSNIFLIFCIKTKFYKLHLNVTHPSRIYFVYYLLIYQ